MDAIQNYKCPCCTAPLVFDAETQNLICESCDFKRFIPVLKDYENRKTKIKFRHTYIVLWQNARRTRRKFLIWRAIMKRILSIVLVAVTVISMMAVEVPIFAEEAYAMTLYQLGALDAFVKAHGGRIRARNLSSGGAEFTFTLDLED